MLDRIRVLSRKAVCGAMALLVLCAGTLTARAQTTTIVLTTGSARAVVNDRSVTMLIPPVFDQTARQTLIPIGFVARQLGYTIQYMPQSGILSLSSKDHLVCVTPGCGEATLDGQAIPLLVIPRSLLGQVLVAAADVPLLLPVQYSHGSTDGSLTFTMSVADPIVEGPVDEGAVTFETRREQVFGLAADFDIVRIDLTGKGIHVVTCQSVGGVGTARYPSAYVDSLKPLALMNATPFNVSSYIMSGSVQDQGMPVYYSGTYISTIGIDPDNTPFYAEGTAHAVVKLDTERDVPVTRINQLPAEASSQSVALYSNYYNGGLSVAASEVLAVVQDGKILRRISAGYFTPRKLAAGQIALYARNSAIVAAMKASVGAELRSYVGTRDCTGSTFVQCGPVVVRAGKPCMDYRTYKDISRTSKLGSRAFIGIDEQKHLYFIVTPAKVRLQFGDVSLALSRLGLFTDVLTLDGGSSTTLYYKGQYIMKGTRALTNVLCVPSS
ncbi:MAG: stalk domain-containing protein [Candidatus Cryosericum sp.]